MPRRVSCDRCSLDVIGKEETKKQYEQSDVDQDTNRQPPVDSVRYAFAVHTEILPRSRPAAKAVLSAVTSEHQPIPGMGSVWQPQSTGRSIYSAGPDLSPRSAR